MRLLLAVVLATFCVSVGTAQAAYTNLSECKSSLTGNPSTNDNDVRKSQDAINSFWGSPVYTWQWYTYYRLTSNRLLVWNHNWTYTGRRFIAKFKCFDDNASGQVSSAEDWNYEILEG